MLFLPEIENGREWQAVLARLNEAYQDRLRYLQEQYCQSVEAHYIAFWSLYSDD